MPPKLALLALAILLAAGALWFFSGDERSVEHEPPPSETREAVAPEVAPVELESPAARALDEPRESSRAALDVEADTRSLSTEHATFDLEHARWLDVTVLLPGPIRPDDRPALLGFARMAGLGVAPIAENTARSIASELDLGDGFAEELDDGVHWARQPLAPSVRLPLAPGAKKGYLLVQSRYFYLDPVEVDLEHTSSITIEPELGAYVTGRCVVPPGAEDRGIEATEFSVDFDGRSRQKNGQDWSDRDSREVRVRPDLSFELRALSTNRTYTIQAEAEGLVRHFERGLELQPGEHRHVELAFQQGATISGIVRGDDGQPIAEAEVWNGVALMPFGGSSSAETEADGTFELTGVPEGKAKLHASKDGWIETESKTFPVADGESVRGLELVLSSGNRVSGRVVWQDGSAAVGAKVTAYARRTADYLEDLSECECDEQGRFLLTGLDRGPFELVAEGRPDGELCQRLGLPAPEPRAPTKQVLTEKLGEEFPFLEDHDGESWLTVLGGVGAGTADVVLTLRAPIAVEGSVVDDTGAPVRSFLITATPAGNTELDDAEVDESFDADDGRFRVPVYFAGPWHIQASAEGYTAAEDAARVDVPVLGAPPRIVLRRAASLTGLVLDPAGRPSAGASVRLSSGGESASQDPDQEADTDESGRFELSDVAASAVSIVADHPDWAASLPQPLELAPGEARPELVLHLRGGARITGEVFDASGDPEADQNVTCGAQVFGFDDESSVSTDASGCFAFEHVTPGKVTIAVVPSQEELFELIESGEDEMAMVGAFGQMRATTIEVKDGEERHVVLGARPKKPVRVHGHVSESDRPVPGVSVVVFAEGGALLAGMKATRTDDDGRYELVVDRPGDHLFRVSPSGEPGGSGIQSYVTVPDVEAFEQNFELPLGRISGRVVGPDREPASGVQVRLSRGDGFLDMLGLDQGAGTATHGDGSFAFDHLQPGNYALTIGDALPLDGSEQLSRFGACVVDGIELAKDREVSGIEVHLSAPGKLAGLVRDESGAPVAGATLFVRDAKGRVVTPVSACTTDAAGRFRCGGIAPGTVTVSARSSELASAESAALEVHAGETSEVELVLEHGAFLVVSVLDGDVAVRASVHVTDAGGRQVNGLYSIQDLQELFTAGFSSKEPRIGPLAPGKYTVSATSPDGKNAKKPVEVEAGQEERRVKLRLD